MKMPKRSYNLLRATSEKIFSLPENTWVHSACSQTGQLELHDIHDGPPGTFAWSPTLGLALI